MALIGNYIPVTEYLGPELRLKGILLNSSGFRVFLVPYEISVGHHSSYLCSIPLFHQIWDKVFSKTLMQMLATVKIIYPLNCFQFTES